VSLKFLLDTNVISEPAKPEPNPAVMRRLRRHEDEVAIASVVWHELKYGVARMPESRRKDRIQEFFRTVILGTIPILDYNQAAAEWHAHERARLGAQGLMPPFADGQIAAVAQTYGLTLVTFNVADYKRFESLKIVTWR
jgi:tRNA(fMet)-specific endonuclease VapC